MTKYNTPFNFWIRSIGGIAVVVAQMFVNGEWLPRPPKELSTIVALDIFIEPVFEFALPPLSSIGGENALYEDIGLALIYNTDLKRMKKATKAEVEGITNMNRIIPVLQVFIIPSIFILHLMNILIMSFVYILRTLPFMIKNLNLGLQRKVSLMVVRNPQKFWRRR